MSDTDNSLHGLATTAASFLPKDAQEKVLSGAGDIANTKSR